METPRKMPPTMLTLLTLNRSFEVVNIYMEQEESDILFHLDLDASLTPEALQSLTEALDADEFMIRNHKITVRYSAGRV